MSEYIVNFGGSELAIRLGENTELAAASANLAEQFANAAGVSADAVEIAAAAVGVYATVGAGEAATTNGQSFYVASGGQVTLYINNAGTGDEVASLVTSAALASTAPGEGAALVGKGVISIASKTDLALTTAKRADLRYWVKGYHAGSSAGGGEFYWDASDLSADVAADPLGGIYVAPDGEDGSLGAFRRVYSPSQGISISWFGAVNDQITDNSAAIQAAYDFASGVTGARVVNWDGQYGFATTINIPASTTTKGTPSDSLGSAGLVASTMIWLGGASPMLSVAATRVRYYDLTVRNNGTATDWIEFPPGGGLPIWDNINFSVPTVANRFSRSVIHVIGQYIGYGKMYRINAAGAPAPKFIYIDGSGEANRITTFGIYDSIIGAGGAAEMTVFYVKNQGIETLNMVGNTFNTNSADSNLILVDTRDTPIASVIFNLNFSENEVDHIGTTAAYRKFFLTNVLSVNMTANEMSLGGQMTAMGTLVNSNVTTYSGNTIRSIGGPHWEADNDSWVVAGANTPGASGPQKPIVDNVTATTGRMVLDPGAVVAVLDTSVYNPSGHNVREVDVTGVTGFSVRADIANIAPATVLTVVVRNISGGAISPVFLSAHFNTNGTFVAPAAGFSRSVTFYHNGTKFVEIGRSDADAAN